LKNKTKRDTMTKEKGLNKPSQDKYGNRQLKANIANESNELSWCIPLFLMHQVF